MLYDFDTEANSFIVSKLCNALVKYNFIPDQVLGIFLIDSRDHDHCLYQLPADQPTDHFVMNVLFRT